MGGILVYNGNMKRLVVAAVLALGSVLTFGVTAVRADVNDFSISSFDIRYALGRDDEGRSTLKTVETIVADFPSTDQNHGLERAIPTSYDDHSTSLKIESVTDGQKALDYTTSETNGNKILRIGDADTYVHGQQTYQITYTQRDVTRHFTDTGRNEFYWDTNGVEWQVPIDDLTVSLVVDDSLKDALTGNTSCYQGAFGEDQPCELIRDQNGTVFTTRAVGLTAGENVTLAIGFAPETFAGYRESLLEFLVRMWFIALAVGGGIGIVAMIWIGIRWSRLTRRSKEIGTIVPEYIPPKDASVTTSASLLANPRTVFTAQLLDFAVRHYLKIYELEKKVLFFGGKDYELEIVRDISDLRDEEREILTDIFSGKTQIGSRLKLSKLQNNNSVYMKTLDNKKKLEALVRGSYGLRKQNAAQSAWFSRAGWALLVAALVLLNPIVLIAAGMTFIMAKTLWPLSDKGLELYRYLEGLKLYIRVAETERLKLLQSPEGAEKVGGVNPNDPALLVKLYERVLPYAVLFGQEKEWNKQIGNLYESAGNQPNWYVSNMAFNAAVFGSAMSSFSTSANYSAASSSSTGGSSGGGSSGGGGGGGGGGGW